MASVKVVNKEQGRYLICRKGGNQCSVEWNVTGKYEIIEFLGEGSYGQVCRARLTAPESLACPQTVVIKRIINVFQSPDDAKRCLREIAILRRLDHPNIIKVLDILEPVDASPTSTPQASGGGSSDAGATTGFFKDLYIVLQDGGIDLLRYFQETSRVKHDVKDISLISKQLCAALSYLHSCRVVHRDLKPCNILIDPRTLCVRIADFGLCRSVELPPGTELADVLPSPRQIRKSQSELNFESVAIVRELFSDDDMQSDDGLLDGMSSLNFESSGGKLMYEQMTRHVVTRQYRAPEVILCSGNYSQAIDVWSIGCILAELLELLKNPDGPNPRGHTPLFNGRSCFPLSPRKHVYSSADQFMSNRDEQLNKIFAIIGSPQDADMDELKRLSTAPTTLAILEQMRQPPFVASALDFRALFKHAPPAAVDLLSRMLRFSAGSRISMFDARGHKFHEEKEGSAAASPQSVNEEQVIQAAHRVGVLRLDSTFEMNERTHRHYATREERHALYQTLPAGQEKERLKMEIRDLDRIIKLCVAAEMMREEIRQFHVDNATDQ